MAFEHLLKSSFLLLWFGMLKESLLLRVALRRFAFVKMLVVESWKSESVVMHIAGYN